MRPVSAVATALALVSTTTAQAATDPGLSVQDSRSASLRTGLTAQFSMKLRLGGRGVVKPMEKLSLSASAGPVMSRLNGTRSAPVMVSASVSPGYRTEFALAGQRVATRYTAAGLAEARAQGLDMDDRKGVSTLGYVAIGAGVVVVATLIAGALIIHDINDCSDGNCE